MLAFLPGFPLFLKFMKRPISALKRFITLFLLPRNRLTFHSTQNPPHLPQQRILRHRTHPWVLSSPLMSQWLPPRNQHPLRPCWIASLTFPHHYAMPTTSAHPLCSRVACRTRSPHLRSHIGTSIQSCFVTLIIGPSTDSRVGAALHSHLVCAAVAPSNEDYSVLFIPSDLLPDFVCPIEWQPLFLYVAASLAYPDLPFLVTTPDYMAGALCTAQGLRSLLHNSCSHILLATADTLISPHLFLHLPPHVPLSPDAMDTGTAPPSLHPFRFRTPDEVSLLVQSTFSDQLSHAVACRASVTEV